MKKLTIKLAALTVALTLPQLSDAQTVPPKKTSATKPMSSIPAKPELAKQENPAPPPSFSPAFYDPNASVLTYLSNDAKKVYDWVQEQMNSLPGKPDQYATSEDKKKYAFALAERMKGIAPIPFIGRCQKKYDADRQAFEVQEVLFSIKDLTLASPNPESLKLRKLTVGRENVKRDGYTGNNAYGATTEVARSVSDEYVLAFPAGPTNEPSSILSQGGSTGITIYRYSFNYLKLAAKMPPVEARENEKQIACIHVFSLDTPYIFKFMEQEFPTRSSPRDTTTNGFALFGKLDKMMVINRETGEVYDQAERSK